MDTSSPKASVPAEPPLPPTANRARSLQGLLVGFCVSVVLSAALVISAAKAGITPGVSPLVVLFGWVVFGVALGPRLKPFLAISQVTGSAGAAVTAGVVFTAPILQILYAEKGLAVPGVDVPLLIVACISGSLLGFGFVGLATKRFLTDPRLPAPEAVAADRLIETAVENPERRPRLSTSLIPGLLGGFLVNALLLLAWMREEVAKLSFHMPGFGRPDPVDPRPGGYEVDLPLPVAPIYLGIGALLTLPTAFLVFLGGFVNANTVGWATANGLPDTTFRWVGGAAMTVAVLYSLVAYVREGRKHRRGATQAGGESAPDADEALLEQSPGVVRMLGASIVLGALLLLVMMLMVGAPPLAVAAMGAVAFVLVSLLSGLGGLLSLQVGSSASPVSGTVFMGMLVLSLTALGVGLSGMDGIVFLVPIVVAACVAICAANDSSQDYKTMQLNGFRVSDGFVGQIVGLCGGAVAVPVTLWIAHDAYELGSPALRCPQASFFATVLDSLFLQADIPWGPVGVGALLGVVAVIVETIGKARGLILSSLAFAVGIYLPSEIGTGMMLGALARFVATFRVSSTTHGGILTAAGLITGDAFAALLLGVFIISGVNTDLWSPGPDASSWVVGETFPDVAGQLALVALMGLVFFNYLRRRETSPP